MSNVKNIRNVMKNYIDDKQSLIDVRNKIEKIEYDMTGVKGISLNGSRGSTNQTKKNEDFLKMSMKLAELKRERERLESNIYYIDSRLYNIPESKIKKAIIEVYINGQPIRKISKEINYSVGGLQKQIDQELKKVLI